MAKRGPVSSSEFSRDVVPVLGRVFNTDRFPPPYTAESAVLFHATVARRLILFPVDYGLVAAELDAVVAGARAVNDDGFYVSMPLVGDDPNDVAPAWYVPLDDLSAYDELELFLETVVVSASGRWGLFIGDEQQAVVGGSNEFMDAFLAAYRVHDVMDDVVPPLEQVYEMLRFVTELTEDDARKLPWVIPLLDHIGVPGRSDAVLAEYERRYPAS